MVYSQPVVLDSSSDDQVPPQFSDPDTVLSTDQAPPHLLDSVHLSPSDQPPLLDSTTSLPQLPMFDTLDKEQL